MDEPYVASCKLIDIHLFGDRLPREISATPVKTDHLDVLRLVPPAARGFLNIGRQV